MHYRHRFKPRVLALALSSLTLGLGALPQFVFAADVDAKTGNAVQATENVATSLETVVVTATRREEALQNVPAAVTAISGSDIQDGELRSTRDVAKFVPGSQGWNTESRARPRFFIRGVGANEVVNNATYPIGVYTDQVYFGNTLFLGSPLFDLQQVEVLRGPQGTLWGKNTTGGAFHFISKSPTFDTDGYAKFEIGNYNTKIVEGAFGGAIKDEVLAARASLHYEDKGGWATNTTTGNPVGNYTDFAGRFQALAVISPDLDVLVNLHTRTLDGSQNPWYSVTRDGAPDRFGYTAPIGDGSGDRDHVAYNTDLPLKVETQGVSATVNWNINNLTLTSITAIDHGSRWGITDSDYTPVEWPTGGRGYTKNAVTQKSQEFRLASPKDDRLTWIGGVYFFRDDNDSFGANANLTGVVATQQYYYTQFKQTTSSNALFGSLSYAFTDAFKLNGGLRYTGETVGIDLVTRKASAVATPYTVSGNWWQPGAVSAPLTTFFSTNGKVEHNWSNLGYDITPEYKLADNQLLFFRHASGFRSGNYNTYINPNSALATVSQFAVVKPEKLKSYEVGYKSSWLDNRLTFNTSVYHYDYKEMQLVVNQVFSGIFFPTLANAGSGTVNGIEFETQYQATRNLKLRANLSGLRTNFTELTAGGVSYAGFNFARVPQVTAFLGADWRLPLDSGASWLLSGDANYTSKVNFNVTNNTDPYALQESFWLGNVRAAYALAGGKTSIGAYINNVSDRRYKNQAMLYQGAVGGVGGHYPTGLGDPRTVGLTLTLKY